MNNAGSAAGPDIPAPVYKCSSCGHSGSVSARCPHCGSLLYWKLEVQQGIQ